MIKVASRPFSVSLTTRLYFGVGILIYSVALPMAVTPQLVETSVLSDRGFFDFCIVIVLLQALLLFAARRCGTAELPYWRGILFISAYMKTSWLMYDPVLVPLAVATGMLASCIAAVSRNPRAKFLRMVQWAYHHRMRQ